MSVEPVHSILPSALTAWLLPQITELIFLPSQHSLLCSTLLEFCYKYVAVRGLKGERKIEIPPDLKSLSLSGHSKPSLRFSKSPLLCLSQGFAHTVTLPVSSPFPRSTGLSPSCLHRGEPHQEHGQGSDPHVGSNSSSGTYKLYRFGGVMPLS